MRSLDAFDPVGSDDVVSRVIHVELACGLDLAAVIVVELQVVGAVPRPGAGLVARRSAGVVFGFADLDPFRRERDARHEQRAHRERAHGAYDDAARHAAPAAVRESYATANVGFGNMGSGGSVIAFGGREQGCHGCSRSHRAYTARFSVSAGCCRR